MPVYSGKAKLLLFGEHCALYGFPAVGVPLSGGIKLKTADSVSDKQIRNIIISKRLSSHAASVHGFLDFTSKKYPSCKKWLNRRIKLSTDIPPGSGLGSSAAFCTAFAAYLLDNCPDVFPDSTIHMLANDLEQYFHGNASGIDTGLSCAKTPLAFYFGKHNLPESRVLPWPDFSIVYGTVPRIADAKEMIARVRVQKEANPEPIMLLLKQLGKCSEDFINILSAKRNAAEKAAETGILCNRAQETLAQLGLSCPATEEAIKAGIEAGSSGGKLSGAGGGGAFWLSAADKTTAKRIRKAVAKVTGQNARIVTV
jgi:mevalonate kinase